MNLIEIIVISVNLISVSESHWSEGIDCLSEIVALTTVQPAHQIAGLY